LLQPVLPQVRCFVPTTLQLLTCCRLSSGA